MKNLLLIPAMMVLCCRLSAQKTFNEKTSIKGEVSFQAKRIESATVLLQLSNDSSLVKGIITDSTGSFKFEDIDSGVYFITVQSLGYKSFTTPALSIDKERKEIFVDRIMLTAVEKSMEEVVVKARKPLIEKKPGLILFNVENSITSTGSNAWDVLNKAPEVKTDNQGNVKLHGSKNAAIMINNKLVNLSGEDLVTMLRGINSESISKMEIISNPSAKYDAEGTGGIINIITKKNNLDGINGIATAGYEQSTYAKYSTGLTLNYKNKKLAAAVNYGYKNGDYLTTEYLDQQFQNGNTTTIYNETLQRKRNQQTNNYKADISYTPDNKNTIGILIDGFSANRNNNDISRTPIKNINGPVDSMFLSHININSNNNYLSLSTNYRHEFDTTGSSLNIDIDYLSFHSETGSVNNNDFLNVNGDEMRPASVFRSATVQSIRIYTSKLDYTLNINSNLSLEAGTKGNLTQTDNNYIFENLINNEFKKDPSSSDHFIYKEGIASMYGDLTRTWSKLTLEAGLRGEYTNTNGNSLVLGQTLARNYFKVFPTLYLQQKFTDNYQLELNYGKRIRRPSYSDMNPFRYYSTPFSYSQGNPFLQPEFTNSLEMIHTFKERYFISLYYTSSKGEFIQIPEQDVVDKTIAFNRINLDRSSSYGISVELPFEVNKWWQSYNSADLSHDGVRSFYLGSIFSYQKTMINITSTQSFVLSKSWSAEVRGNYRSPSISGLFHLGTYSEVDLGIKRKLLKNKAVLAVNFSDIFRGTIMSARVNYLNQNSKASTDNDLRSIRISFSYKFGSSKNNKQQKPRDTGNSEEQKRVSK